MKTELVKKPFETPKLVVYGSFENLTQLPQCKPGGIPIRNIEGGPTGYCNGTYPGFS